MSAHYMLHRRRLVADDSQFLTESYPVSLNFEALIVRLHVCKLSPTLKTRLQLYDTITT